MQESYVEGLASHSGPESCVHTRKGVGEALTGVRVGRVSSREIDDPRREVWSDRGAEAVETGQRPHRGCRIGEAAPDPARSETPRTRGNISLGNREIPRPSTARWEATLAERIVKPKGTRR
jgi:RNA-directed DNA polymerase